MPFRVSSCYLALFKLRTQSETKFKPSKLRFFSLFENYSFAKILRWIYFYLFVCLGYRRRRISFCLTALTSVSIMAYLVLLGEDKFSLTINILIALSIGLIASLFATVLLYCGYFITGLFAGFVIGIIFLLILSSFTTVLSIAVSCVVVAGFGLVQVFITMWWRHRVYIVSSCVFAAGLAVCALDYFVEGFFLLSYIEFKVFYHRTAELCWWTYLIFAMFCLFLVIGLIVQCFYTGKEVQKEPYTFVYLTKRTLQRKKTERHTSTSQHDEENYLINSNG